MIKIMADSTCDLSDEIIKKYNIGIAPLTIMIDGKEYKDRIDIEPDDFYKILAGLEVEPTTSMPSPAQYLKIISEAIAEGYSSILCICMSSGTSGAYQSAVLAKESFYEEAPDSPIKIHVVDSTSMSHGSGLLILQSAMLRDEGFSFEELVDFNETYKRNVKHFLSVDDLKNLIRSGRLSNASAIIGTILKVKPIMTMRNTRGVIVAKERGMNRVFKHYIREFNARNDWQATRFIIIGYTSDRCIAETLKEKIINETEFKGEIFIMQMGVAVGTHVGSGGISMFFIEKGHQRDSILKNEINGIVEKKTRLISKLKKK